jgi:hypothetical protein
MRYRDFDDDSDIKILGRAIPMLAKEKTILYLEFMEEYLQLIQGKQEGSIKIKFTINYRFISGKKISYPYFEMRIE